MGIALQTGQLERFVRIGHAVGGRNMYAHFRSDADGQQAHGELLPVGLHGEQVGQGRSGESSVGIDRTGRRQHVVVGGEGDYFGVSLAPRASFIPIRAISGLKVSAMGRTVVVSSTTNGVSYTVENIKS